LHINAIATQRTIGVAGNRTAHFDLCIGEDCSTFDGIGIINTTNNMNISITAQWNNAKSGNSLQLNQAITEFKN